MSNSANNFHNKVDIAFELGFVRLAKYVAFRYTHVGIYVYGKLGE